MTGRRIACLLLLAALPLAGCLDNMSTGDSRPGGRDISRTDDSREQANTLLNLTLLQIERYYAANPPSQVEVRLENAGSSDIIVSRSNFRLVDEQGTVHPETAPACYGSRECFPNWLTLRPGEVSQGWLRFGGVPPADDRAFLEYRLDYQDDEARAEISFLYPPSPPHDAGAATATIGEWIDGDLVDLRLVMFGTDSNSWNWTLEVRWHNGSTPVQVEMRFPWSRLVDAAPSEVYLDSPKFRPYPDVSVKAILYQPSEDPSKGATKLDSVDYSWAWD